MNEFVFLKSNQALTTSLKVAEVFEKRHKNVLRAIENAKSNLRNFAPVEKAIIRSNYTDAKGESRPMYLLNRDGFTFVVMGFTGERANQFKWQYIQAFNAMEQILLNQRNEEWKAIREAGKRGNRAMCDAIHDYVIPLARARGSKAPDTVFYMNYQKMINKWAGVQPNSRDSQPLGQLYEIEKMQDMIETSIKGLAARGDDDKSIYRGINQIVESYSRISLIPQRFLTA